MKIAVNLLRFLPDKNIGGNYTYAYSIVKFLLINDKQNVYYLFLRKKSREMFNYRNSTNLRYEFFEGKENIYREIRFENNVIRKKIKEKGIDLLFSPCFLLSYRKLNIPTVATIHDINFKHFSQGLLKDLYKQFIYKKTFKDANIITTVSEFTKKDIISNFHVDPNKVHVINNASNIIDIDVDYKGFKKEYNINYNYILVISHYKHKNARFAIQVFKKSKQYLPKNMKLLITGAKNELKKELNEFAQSLNISNEIKFIDYVDNKYISTLYKQASLFLYPSLFEGFGIPILEAMNMGCPVITSNRASLPEVMGGYGLSIELDATKWADYTVRVMSNENFKQKLINQGFERCKQFSWEESAKKLIYLFNTL